MGLPSFGVNFKHILNCIIDHLIVLLILHQTKKYQIISLYVKIMVHSEKAIDQIFLLEYFVHLS